MSNIITRIRRPKNAPEPTAYPGSLSISVDKLKLILTEYATRVERSARWGAYAGLAGSMWASIVVSDFSFTDQKYGLTGAQWQVLFIIVAVYATARTLLGLVAFFRRPKLASILQEIISSAEYAREHRAICLIKFRGADHEHHILVYRDPLWDCYLMPHCNIVDVQVSDVNDPTVLTYISGALGISPADMTATYVRDRDLRSRKHSEFYRQDALYRFGFFSIGINDNVATPQHLRAKVFTWHGLEYSWLTLSEMEADANTRHRNLDVTRHVRDNVTALLVSPKDSVVAADIPLP